MEATGAQSAHCIWTYGAAEPQIPARFPKLGRRHGGDSTSALSKHVYLGREHCADLAHLPPSAAGNVKPPEPVVLPTGKKESHATMGLVIWRGAREEISRLLNVCVCAQGCLHRDVPSLQHPPDPCGAAGSAKTHSADKSKVKCTHCPSQYCQVSPAICPIFFCPKIWRERPESHTWVCSLRAPWGTATKAPSLPWSHGVLALYFLAGSFP